MAQYSYKARNKTGQLVTGNLTAVSELEAIVQLRRLEYTPVKISQGIAVKVQGSASGFFSFKLPFLTANKVKLRDIMLFCTNFSSMSGAGVPILSSLNMASDQTVNPVLSSTLRKVSQMVSDGSSFSDALAVFPNIFNHFFVNMIRAAEISGTMEKVLADMAVYLEKQDNLRQTIRGMFIYPIVLLTACVGVIILIITFVMPQFVEIFTKANVPLPAPTRLLYEAGLWIKKYPLFYIPVLIAIVFGVKSYIKTNKGKDLLDQILLKIPLIGSVLNKTMVARFCRTLATMLTTGVPMLQSLDIVRQVLGNKVFGDIVKDVHDSVERGETIHKTLMSHPQFPKDVTYMISVGETSGNTGMMLNKVADFYESKVQFEVKDLMVLIEPSFVAVMGVCVGGILASIILPMFDMIKTIQH